MLTWNYGETKQHCSVVFESWKPEKLLDSGILMKDKRRVANDVDSCGNSMFYYDCINLSDRKSFEKTF